MLLTPEDFRAALGQPFGVAEVPEVTLTLARLEPLANSRREGGGFRLEFTGAATLPLPQGLYTLRSAGTETAVFIVPVAGDGDSLTYEAIFN